MKNHIKNRFLSYSLFLCCILLLPLLVSYVHQARAAETVQNQAVTSHTWTTDEFEIEGSDIDLSGSGSIGIINACDDPGVTCDTGTFNPGSGFDITYACAGHSSAASTGGWQETTTGTGGECWSNLDVCYYHDTINQFCHNPPGDFTQPNMKIVAPVTDCSTVPAAQKTTSPSSKEFCSVNYVGSGTILGDTGDDMFKIEKDARAFMVYKRPANAGKDPTNEMELNLIERTGGGAHPNKDMMLPSGPFTTFADYKRFINNPPAGVIDVTPACYPVSVTLCSGPNAAAAPAISGVCNTANATYVDNRHGTHYWSPGGIPNDESEALSASPTKCVKGLDTPVSLVNSPYPRFTWTCEGIDSTDTPPVAASDANCSVMKTVDGSCGPSHTNSYYTAPAPSTWCGDDRSNPPSGLTVTATGWSWQCEGVPNNTLASPQNCYANRIVDGTCGSADGSSFYTAPATANRCASGTMVDFVGAGPWTWTCQGAFGGLDENCSAQLKVDGVCGPAHNSSSSFAPTTGLCNVGGASSVVSSGGSYQWACSGQNGGINASCSTAPPPSCNPGPTGSDVNGTCGNAHGGTFTSASAVSSAGRCQTGTATSITTNASTYTWNCQGTGTGTGMSCSAGRIIPVDGTCGTADGTTSSTAPSGAALCSSGSATTVSNNATNWTWGCNGSSGGTSTAANECVQTKPATPVNGACGTADGTTSSTAPSGAALCSSGSATTVSNNATNWTWGCNGSSGGASTAANECVRSKPSITCSTAAAISTSGSTCVDMGYTEEIGTSYEELVSGHWSSSGFGSASSNTGNCLQVGPPSYSTPGQFNVYKLYTIPACVPSSTDVCGNADGGTYPYSADVSNAGQCDSGTASSITSTSTQWNWTCGSLSCSAARCNPPTLGNYGAAGRLIDWDGWVGDGCYNQNQMIQQLKTMNGGTFPPDCGTAAANNSSNRICITQLGYAGDSGCGGAYHIFYDGMERSMTGGNCPPPPENGICGTDNGDYVTTQPTGSGACFGSSTLSNMSVAGSPREWTWNCSGEPGGLVRTCSAREPSASMCNDSGTWRTDGQTWGHGTTSCDPPGPSTNGSMSYYYRCDSGTINFVGSCMDLN